MMKIFIPALQAGLAALSAAALPNGAAAQEHDHSAMQAPVPTPEQAPAADAPMDHSQMDHTGPAMADADRRPAPFVIGSGTARSRGETGGSRSTVLSTG
jgi:uncharacterized protein involved in copper resistance